MWNALGALIEDEGIINDTSSDVMIQYVTPKEYIWVRRRDLFGAELRIGYVESPPYIQVVYNNSEIVYGNKVALGNTVILNEDRVKTQIMHLLNLWIYLRPKLFYIPYSILRLTPGYWHNSSI